uniref:Tripartite motif-containing protein 3-like isoform X2 n=1 Tax=Crassostrea virginica TaxID=6565 RepID=A0A8B8CBA7_CRAVI|nr:tripartite motif-containing protein 3-like isoform X2 [Crassostrea virginica]XP_022311987.1 tripartite motif-containing protein 3-like isoform X2 [Crassostrea virginica]XP_022311988.1 tripartite motif-containing protein 3-like isoform X2 [Crassostrea virginica]
MATSTSWAQDVITCDLCDKPTQQFCNSCQVSLCSDCVSKHTDAFKSMSHEIAPFLDRNTKLVLPVCQEHFGQRCEVNCKECNKPVCLKCIVSGTHKGHDVEELTETHENKILKIKSDTEEINAKLIPKYQKEDVEIGKKISKTKSKIDDLGKESKKLRKLWHQEVDNIFDKIDSLSQSPTEKNLNALQEYHNKIRDLISEMNTIVKQNEKLFTSNKLTEVNEYKSQLNKYQDFPEHVDLEVPSLRSNVDQGKELIIEIGGYRATLKQMSPPSPSADVSRLTTGIGKLMDQVRVIATIATNYKPLFGFACVGGAEAWIYGLNETITRIDIHGTVRDTVTILCLNMPNDISVTRGRKLIYSVANSETVTIVSHGKSETLIITPQGWRPGRLSCTRSGDILVQMQTGGRSKHKIIRYQGQNIKREINKDGQGNPIFKDGFFSLFMSENNNGDVCVSDPNAGTVVVVDKTGRVRFRYDGTPASREKAFSPRGIVTDALNQIIVADYNNNCLHILDQNGQFLRCVDDCGLEHPFGLSVDSKGRLWVGFVDTGEIKVIQYLEQ